MSREPGPRKHLFSYEHHRDRLIQRSAFYRRVAKTGLVALAVVVVSLAIGILGYRLTEGLSWLDALLNASMILGGMGPVAELHTPAGKWFASFYALFSGIAFLSAVGILVAPILHRFLHKMHLDPEPGRRSSSR